MPLSFTPAPVHLRHNGVRIYVVFKDDDADNNPARTYRYGLTSDASDHDPENTFDVRDLPNEAGHDVDTEEGRDAIIRDAIDAGLLEGEPDASTDRTNPEPGIDYSNSHTIVFQLDGHDILSVDVNQPEGDEPPTANVRLYNQDPDSDVVFEGVITLLRTED